MRRDIFQAIADPTRRAIIALIALQAMTPNALAEQFHTSRQAVSKHLRILTECEIVTQNQQGREIYYQLQIEKMKEIDKWLEQFRKIWESRFDNLDKYLAQIQKSENMAKQSDTSNRELRISRVLQAPVELVWEVWTDPDHIKNWWGPDGFSNTIHKMDVKEEGEWLLTMHGPDGKNYPNRSIFKEIVKHKKIVYQHFNPNFITTVEFTPQQDKTLMNWHMLFETNELFEAVVKTFGADKGLQQNVSKLENYLSLKISKL